MRDFFFLVVQTIAKTQTYPDCKSSTFIVEYFCIFQHLLGIFNGAPKSCQFCRPAQVNKWPQNLETFNIRGCNAKLS